MEELNKLRTKIKKKYIIGIWLSLLAAFIGTFILKFKNPLFFLAIGIVVTIFVTYKDKQKYKKMYKRDIVKVLLEDKVEELEYYPDKGIPYNEIADLNVINMGDKYSSEDFISGKYKGVPFRQADVRIIEESTDSEGKRTEYVTFMGRWMIFDFNKIFKANVQVVQKGFKTAKHKRLFVEKESRYKKVSMESEVFNKLFTVYAQNEHDAYYLLTPSIMERLSKIINNNMGKMMFCFIDNKLHVAINNGKNSFEPGSVFKSLNIDDVKQKTISEIDIITQFVDELNLENNIFINK